MPKIPLKQLVDDDINENQYRRVRSVPHRGRRVLIDEQIQHREISPLEAGSFFSPTFTSSFHEREWILDFLGPFYDEDYLTDVLRQVAGGKEATVYCCRAHPSMGFEYLAAKVYRPRQFRKLRNDARYKQNRDYLDDNGRTIRDEKQLIAIQKKTRLGKALSHNSWLQHEYQTLRLLYQAGCDVPQPLAAGENAFLMEYLGDPDAPAVPLNGVNLPKNKAVSIFDRLLYNVELMLACNRIHGDLSPYNVLYFAGEVKIIDFPQAIDPYHNPDAIPIFIRDVTLLCQYFEPLGIKTKPKQLAMEIWDRHIEPGRDQFTDPNEE